MSKIKFEIEMYAQTSQGEFELEHIEEQIIKEAAQILANGIKKDVTKQVVDSVRTAVQQEIVEELKVKARAILEAGIEQYNTYGESTGKTLPIKQFIIDRLCKNGDSYSNGKTIAENIFDEIVRKEMKEELGKIIVNKRNQLAAMVDAELMKVFFEVAKNKLNINLG